MRHAKAMAGAAALSLAVGGSGVALAAAGPKRAVIKQSTGISFKPNRFVKDELRWNKDVYHVRHGGTLVLKWNVRDEGQHTFSVVRRKDLPRTNKAFAKCFSKGICGKLAAAHGATDENTPPKFLYLENGKGSATPPKINKPGDSVGIGFVPPHTRYKPIRVKVTAKKGTVLNFMCIIHPQMQAKVVVGP